MSSYAYYASFAFWAEAARCGAVDASWLAAHPPVCVRAVSELSAGSAAPSVPAAVASAACTLAVDSGRAQIPDASLTGLELARGLIGLTQVPASVQRRLLTRFRDDELRCAAAGNPSTSAPVLRQLAAYNEDLTRRVALHPNLSAVLRARLWTTETMFRLADRLAEGWRAMPRRRAQQILSGLCEPGVHTSVLVAMWPVVCTSATFEVQRQVIERLLVGPSPISELTAGTLVSGVGPQLDATIADAVRVGATTGSSDVDTNGRAAAVAAIHPSVPAVERAAEDPSWLTHFASWSRWWWCITATVDEVAATDPAAALRCAVEVLAIDDVPDVIEHLDTAGLYRVAESDGHATTLRFDAVRRLAAGQDPDAPRLRAVLEVLSAHHGRASPRAWEAYLGLVEPTEALDAPAAVVPEITSPELRRVCFEALAEVGNTALVRELCDEFPGSFAELLAIARLG